MQKVKQKKSKKNKEMEDLVMEKIQSGEIKMKPKWYFVIGSLLSILGLIGLTVGAIFLTNLTIFLIKKQGPGYGKINMMLSSFPFWVPLLAILAIVVGVWLLRKYDFSYKKNFPAFVIVFIISVILAALIIDSTGLNDTWSRRGPMRGFYQQFNTENNKSSTHGRAVDNRKQ